MARIKDLNPSNEDSTVEKPSENPGSEEIGGDNPQLRENTALETTGQAVLYFTFAALMIGLNMLIQNLHKIYIVGFVEEHFGQYGLVRKYYLSTTPYNMPEFVGSVIAVVITYIIKFILDKYIVFRKQSGKTSLKRTKKEFLLYFLFAIFTTLENIGIQFLLGLWTDLGLNTRITIALVCGYATKFVLDKKYSFNVSE